MCVEALGNEFLPDNPKPVRIDRFIEKHFKCPIVYEALPDGVLGCTAFNKDATVKAVFISTSLEDGHLSSERRLRSTLAHEAGHCLMHGSLFLDPGGDHLLRQDGIEIKNVEIKQKRILCRPDDINPGATQKRYDGRWWEWQANRAIGGFLLPKPLVRDAVRSLLRESVVTRSPTLANANRPEAEKILAQTFDVNPVVARIRLSEMFPIPTGQIEF